MVHFVWLWSAKQIKWKKNRMHEKLNIWLKWLPLLCYMKKSFFLFIWGCLFFIRAGQKSDWDDRPCKASSRPKDSSHVHLALEKAGWHRPAGNTVNIGVLGRTCVVSGFVRNTVCSLIAYLASVAVLMVGAPQAFDDVAVSTVVFWNDWLVAGIAFWSILP